MILVLLMLAAIHGFAQVGSSHLSGSIRDGQAAAVVQVKITARHEATGFSRVVLSGMEGEYSIENLLPGLYALTAEKAGFRTLTVSGINLGVNQQARFDFELQPGHPGESITVTARISPVAADEASTGYRVDYASAVRLPLLGRNPVSLVTLGPGAIPRHLGGFTHDVVNDVQPSRGAVALNPPIHGARSTMNASLVDGASNTDRNTFAAAVHVPLEAMLEFRTVTTLASAEFPNTGGGVVDLVTKSGSRSYHGSAFEYFRNEATDARNFFDDPLLPRPIFRRNQFGGSLSGPLPLPRSVFFVTYEGVRGKSAKSSLNLVPDAALRSGDFRGRNTIFDPLSRDASGNRLPFPNNTIPASRIDPIAQRFLSEFQPLPNRTGGTSNYLDATPSESRDDNASARVDHEFTSGARVFGRYTVNDERARIAGVFPLLPTAQDLRAQQAAIGLLRAESAWLNEARVAFTRLRAFSVPESAFTRDIAGELGIGGVSADPSSYGLPFFLVTNFNLRTDDPILPQTQRNNQWQFSDSVSVARGRHTLKFGGEWLRSQNNYLQSRLSRGQFVFTGAFTANEGGPSGDAFADFLLGYPQITSRSAGSAQAYMRQHVYSGFTQDEWRANGRLTLTLGIRYDFISPWTEKRGNLLNLDYSMLPSAPRLVRTERPADPDRNNVSPRLGFALRLPRLPKPFGELTFRAGYGVYYSPEIAIETYDLVRNGIRNEMNATDGNRPILSIRNGFPQTASTGFPSYFGLDPAARTPYVQQWTGTLQRELPGNAVVELAYVGTKGTRLGRFRTFNTPLRVETGENLPPRPGDLQSLRPFPELGEIVQRQHIANSIYHALEIKTEKRLASRFSVLASFAWAKSIDDADGVIPGQFDSFGAQDERNLRLERGLSFFDVRRRLSAAFVYQVHDMRWLRPLFAGWELSGIMTLQDGTPLNPVYFAFDPANTGTPNRPDVVPGQKVALSRSERSADRFFNTDAFRAPAPYTFGNAGRNILPGPGNALLDSALSRRFRMAEHATILIRAEVFNVFNHPNFGIPGPYPDFGPFFGKIFSTGDPRRMQFGARLEF
jgi:outer membrane receptor protein involved in Fe transport